MYTEPQRHYTGRTIHEKETVQSRTDKTVLLGKNTVLRAERILKDVLRAEARNVRLFAKEFGQGVWQSQRQHKEKE